MRRDGKKLIFRDFCAEFQMMRKLTQTEPQQKPVKTALTV